jgi:chaperonin cofactor prefoldin
MAAVEKALAARAGRMSKATVGEVKIVKVKVPRLEREFKVAQLSGRKLIPMLRPKGKLEIEVEESRELKTDLKLATDVIIEQLDEWQVTRLAGPILAAAELRESLAKLSHAVAELDMRFEQMTERLEARLK